MTIPNPFNAGYYETNELLDFGFKHVGHNVKIAKNCTIIGLNNISLGNNIRIDGETVLAANSGSLTLGNYIHIGGGCFLGCAARITLSDFCGLSQYVCIYSGSDNYSGEYLTNPTVPKKYLCVNIAPVVLHKHVIIGASTVILPGVTIGEGSSVGALSLVRKLLDEWGIYFGSPIKRMKPRSRKLLELERNLLDENN